MDHTQDDIQEVLLEKATERWQSEQRPYLLADVGADMKLRGIDYRTILGEERIKGFVQRTQHTAGYRLVEHPFHKAKIGIIPTDAEFSFVEAEGEEVEPPRKPASPPREGREVIAFLRALSRLPDADQDAVVIPVRVLTKLLGLR